jgi:hypothetical protein
MMEDNNMQLLVAILLHGNKDLAKKAEAWLKAKEDWDKLRAALRSFDEAVYKVDCSLREAEGNKLSDDAIRSTKLALMNKIHAQGKLVEELGQKICQKD